MQDVESHSRAIKVLLVRGANGRAAEFEARVLAACARYADSVDLEMLGWDEMSELHPELDLEWHGASKIVILRGDHVIGQATGCGLPARELEGALRRAVGTCH